MRALLLLTSALAGASPGLAVGRHDLAVQRVRVPAQVKLDDRHATVTARAAVRITNRGSAPAVFADAASLAAGVRFTAAALTGPITCPPVGIALARRRFPLTVRPGRSRTLRYRLAFTCGANPDRKADWRFGVVLDHVALDGNVDENPANDACPRAPSASDRGCGIAGPDDTRVGPETDVRDARAGTRFELPGPYGVGETSLVLVDSSRPTMPNGTFAGALDRTLQTAVWYPATPGTSGRDVALAVDGRPFPLVVFGHALGSYNSQSMFLTTHLASHGYVVAAPAFPLSNAAAPGGARITDLPAQAGDITFVIDAFLGFASAAGNRFAGGIDAERIAMSGHSGGALTTLVAAYDQRLRDPRIKAALPFSPPGCFFQQGYFDAAGVPLLILQGDRDLLADAVGDATAVFTRARPPKTLVVVREGNHLGFADVGTALDDGFVCQTFPDRTDLNAQLAAVMAALGGSAAHLAPDGCPTLYCAGDTAHVDGRRQQQIGKEAALAFFEDVLRGDAGARRYLETLAARNPDLTSTSTPAQEESISNRARFSR
jgi:predicted dienelactone hydrolase